MRLHLLFVLLDMLMLIAMPLVFVLGKLRHLRKKSSAEDHKVLH